MAALVVGAATVVALIIMFVWIAVSMAGGAGGFAIMSVLPILGPVVLALGILGTVLGILAVARQDSRRLGIIGLLCSVTPVLVWLILSLVAIPAG